MPNLDVFLKLSIIISTLFALFLKSYTTLQTNTTIALTNALADTFEEDIVSFHQYMCDIALAYVTYDFIVAWWRDIAT